MARRRSLVAALFFALFLVAPCAFAQRVLVLRPPTSDATLYEAFGRLRAELMLDNFEVEVLNSHGRAVDPAALEAEAQRTDSFAAIALTRQPDGAIANVCIVDRLTGKISQRKLSIDAKSDTPTLLAVRAVDLLRASLRELDPGEKPPAEVVGVDPGPMPTEVQQFSAEPSHFQLRAGAIALGFGSELGGAYGPALAAEYRPISALGVGLLAAARLGGARYVADNGVATVTQEIGLVRVFWNVLADSSGPFRVGPLLGAGVYHLEARSDVEPPLVSETDELWSFAGNAGLGAELSLTSALSLNADFSALLLTPRAGVAIYDRQVVQTAPLLTATLGIGVVF